jgi:hypothetical protein
MNRQRKKPGCGNRGKTNCVFPPFPQPLLLLTNQNEKAANQKQKTIVYTKSLTLPEAREGWFSHTPLSEVLSASSPESVKALAVLYAQDWFTRPMQSSAARDSGYVTLKIARLFFCEMHHPTLDQECHHRLLAFQWQNCGSGTKVTQALESLHTGSRNHSSKN